MSPPLSRQEGRSWSTTDPPTAPPASGRTEYSNEELIDAAAKTATYMNMRRKVPLADAEDAAAYACREARRSLDSGKHIDKLQAWMRRTASNFYGEQVRRRAKHVLYEDVDSTGRPWVDYRDDPGFAVELRDSTRRVLAFLDRLPDNQRDAMALRVLYDMTDAEIAEHLGVRQATVRKRISRAHSTLQAMGRETVVAALDIVDKGLDVGDHPPATGTKTLQERGGP